MKISILTLFPGMFAGPFDQSIISKAERNNLCSITFINIREYATDRYKTVDERPYGGGKGMILKVDVVDRAIIDATEKSDIHPKDTRRVLLDPQGTVFSQKHAHRLSLCKHLILICAHYEGIDERIRALVDEEVSIGDYILTGGELPAMVIVDSVVRLIPGVLSSVESVQSESFENSLLEYPQYTRPEEYNDMKVPDVLLSGNHKNIAQWRRSEALMRTGKRRPDLLNKRSSE